MADLKTRWHLVAPTLVCASGPRGLIEQILKFGFVLLESGGADVGQVVGDDVEIRLLELHPGRGTIEDAQHNRSIRPGRLTQRWLGQCARREVGARVGSPQRSAWK